jgi:hypothetical protein
MADFTPTISTVTLSGIKNEFGILGCYMRDNARQKSIGKAKFTYAEGCATDRAQLASMLVRCLLRFYL